MTEMPDEKLTWEEIKEQYPDEWVLVVDYERDPSTVVAAGRVLEHSADKKVIHERLRTLQQDSAIAFTGKPRANIVMGMTRATIEE